MVRHKVDQLIGGKATGLLALQKAGLPVPPFFILSAEEAGQLFLPGTENLEFIHQAIERMVESQLRNEPPVTRKPIADQCFSRLQEPPPRSRLTLNLHSQYRELAPADEARTMIVRSSSPLEDGAGTSGAGVFCSIADVTDFQSLIRGLHQVEASAWSETALTRLSSEPDLTIAFPLPVVIQRQIQGSIYGVAFSEDPGPGGKNYLRIEWGSGRDDVVNGRSIGNLRLSRDATRREREKIPAGFNRRDLDRLIDMVLTCEELVGGPADVEFAFTAAGVVLLQARPAWHKPEADPSITWSDLNAAEAFPGVLTPYTASFVDHTLGSIIRRQLAASGFHTHLQEPLTGFIHGRVFFNLDVIRSIFNSLPLPIDIDCHLRPLLGGQELPPLNDHITKRSVNLLQFATGSIGYLKRIWQIYRDFEVFHDTTRSELQSLNRQTTKTDNQLQAATEMMFPFTLLSEILERQILISLAALFLHTLTSRLLEAALGRRNVILDDSATTGLEETDWLHLLRRLQSNGIPHSEAIPQLMSQMGYLCPAGQDLAAPRLQNCPELLQTMLEVALPTALDSTFRPATIRSRRLERQATSHPLWGGWVTRSRLWLRRTIILRERFKLLGLRGCLALKQWLEGPVRSQLGLDHPEDIHFLTCEEVRRLMAGREIPEAPQRRIRTRQRLHQALQRRRTASLYVHGQPVFPQIVSRPGSGLIKGIPGGSGTASGLIHHVHDGDSAARFPTGAVLVVPILDPLHTPLIARASAVVSGRGGLLSHGAIVSRELGVPLVLELGNLLETLIDGKKVNVDGDTGTITMC